MPKILTVSLNPAIDVFNQADSVRMAHKVRTFDETYDAGGGAVNVARVITELGGDVEVLYLAGGVTGDLLNDLLERDRIRRHLIHIAGNTRISFTVYERSTGHEYRFVGNGPTLSSAELDKCVAAVGETDFQYLIASGSLPVGVPSNIYATMAKIAATKRARFILDSSGHGLSETIGKAPVYFMKPSINELEHLVGHKLDEKSATETALDFVNRGIAEIVAVTMAAEGVLLVTGTGVWREPAIKVEARSTVGAGDSFVGAMTLALSEGRDLDDALLYAIAAGGAAVLKPGTKLCTLENTTRLYEEELRVRQLAPLRRA